MSSPSPRKYLPITLVLATMFVSGITYPQGCQAGKFDAPGTQWSTPFGLDWPWSGWNSASSASWFGSDTWSLFIQFCQIYYNKKVPVKHVSVQCTQWDSVIMVQLQALTRWCGPNASWYTSNDGTRSHWLYAWATCKYLSCRWSLCVCLTVCRNLLCKFSATNWRIRSVALHSPCSLLLMWTLILQIETYGMKVGYCDLADIAANRLIWCFGR